MWLGFSNIYALHKSLYWHKALGFNSWRMLSHNLGKCHKASMSIINLFCSFKICDWVSPDVVG